MCGKMQIFIFAFLAGCIGLSVSIPHNFDWHGTHIQGPCNIYKDVTHKFRSDMYDFTIKIYKAVAARSTDFNFVFSPLSVWIILSGMAEGADFYNRKQLFNFLSLPYDECTRQKYYQLATSHIVQAHDIKIISDRILLLDAGVTPNPTWYNIVTRNNLLNVYTAPIRHSNSVILDTIDYNALWTTEFGAGRIERSPFYDLSGNQVGYVDLMKVTTLARLSYVKSIKAKMLELPIGENGRYRMLFAMFSGSFDITAALGSVTNNSAFEVFESFKEDFVPVEVALPRQVVYSELDMRTLIEDLGVTSLWNDPAATRHVSYPPALPSSFIQRATLTLDYHGLHSPPPPRPSYGTPSGPDPQVGNNFIANRPFLYALCDAETYTVIMASAFSVPTYKN
ncbi:hypothetical protein PYW07_010412 [Mythimna separata]|uniref:Serpin domain-containing protein n=1 Tax=Mythimna separata TaxID=271217 RepID=A0AAD7YAI7_MYTSE|nr:hypothetical protein PYW07_010412 [Mythimna separata]